MLIENNNTFLSELSRLFSINCEKGRSLYITMKRLSEKPPESGIKYKRSVKGQEQKKGGKKNAGRRQDTKAPTTSSQPQASGTAAAAGEPQSSKCLIRAHIGNKKISTVIQAKDLDEFKAVYGSLLRSSFYGLKKKDKKKITAAGGSGGATKKSKSAKTITVTSTITNSP